MLVADVFAIANVPDIGGCNHCIFRFADVGAVAVI